VTSITLLLLSLSSAIDVPAGEPLDAALARAVPGDVVTLGPGLHRGSLGRLAGVRVAGAGAGISRILVPEGEDGAVVTGRVELAGLTIEAGPRRFALKVLGGEATLEDVALTGGAGGAFLDGGTLVGRGLVLEGEHGLLVASGDATLRAGRVGARPGAQAGVALLRGRLSLARFTVTGPFTEAAVTVAGGAATLEEVVIRDPGPTGLAVWRGEVIGRDVEIAGAREVRLVGAGGRPGIDGIEGMLGDCVQLRRGTVRLEASALARCGGAAVTASGGALRLDGVDLQGGTAGGLILLDGARGDLRGNWITGRGPGLVLAGTSAADATFNRWRTDPVFWVECGAGARVRLGFGEHAKEPCGAAK
jgi:hypothetical protein